MITLIRIKQLTLWTFNQTKKCVIKMGNSIWSQPLIKDMLNKFVTVLTTDTFQQPVQKHGTSSSSSSCSLEATVPPSALSFLSPLPSHTHPPPTHQLIALVISLMTDWLFYCVGSSKRPGRPSGCWSVRIDKPLCVSACVWAQCVFGCHVSTCHLVDLCVCCVFVWGCVLKGERYCKLTHVCMCVCVCQS